MKKKWSAIETTLLSCLTQSAFTSTHLSDEQKIKWQVSVTEMEVRQGLLNRPDGHRSLYFQRDIEGFPTASDTDAEERRLMGRFIELSDSSKLKIDEQVQEKIETLRCAVIRKGVTQESYVQKWAEVGITEESHGEYIKKFGETFYQRMVSGVGSALAKQTTVDPIAVEAATHLTFASNRGQLFFGREHLVQKGKMYLSKKLHNNPFVIYGASGSGKTSVLASLALKATSEFSSVAPILLTRFCGTTSNSSSVRLLIQSMIEHVGKAYQRDTNIPETFKDLKETFRNCLDFATKDKPLIIMIDSLDQLNDADQGRSDLSWLPIDLPEHVYLIVSTLPDVGGCYKALRQTGIPQDHYLEVQPISMDEAHDIITGSMKRAKRKLQPSQLKQLLKNATDSSEEEPTVLRLRLLLDIALKLKSANELPALPVTVRRLIDRFLENLEMNHGDTLVSHLFGLLGASTHGLGEQTLQDILAGDDEVLDSVLQYHQPPIRRIPQVRCMKTYVRNLFNVFKEYDIAFI